MNRKTISKIMAMLLIALMFVITIVPSTLAVQDPSIYTGDSSDVDTSRIDGLGQDIIAIVSTVGSIISVIVLVVLGIKYMMGSAEEKAEYKKTLLPYIIGAALVFAASTIASVVFNFASSI